MSSLNVIRLDEVKVGKAVTVMQVRSQFPSLYRRLTEFGVIPGVSIKVVRMAPFGCPIQVEMQDFCIALRLVEAAEIMVKDQTNNNLDILKKYFLP